MQDVASFLRSFVYAVKGFVWMVFHERNFRVHLTCLAYMLYFLIRYDFFILSKTEWAILIIAASLVIGSEMINTGIEKADDAASREKKYAIKVSKDVAAGAVLIFAVSSVIIGLVLLWQPEAFRALFDHYARDPVYLIPLGLSFIVGLLFIFRFDARYLKNRKSNSEKEKK